MSTCDCFRLGSLRVKSFALELELIAFLMAWMIIDLNNSLNKKVKISLNRIFPMSQCTKYISKECKNLYSLIKKIPLFLLYYLQYQQFFASSSKHFKFFDLVDDTHLFKMLLLFFLQVFIE